MHEFCAPAHPMVAAWGVWFPFFCMWWHCASNARLVAMGKSSWKRPPDTWKAAWGCCFQKENPKRVSCLQIRVGFWIFKYLEGLQTIEVLRFWLVASIPQKALSSCKTHGLRLFSYHENNGFALRSAENTFCQIWRWSGGELEPGKTLISFPADSSSLVLAAAHTFRKVASRPHEK